MDDVLLFGTRTLEEWICFSEVIKDFSKGVGMEVSLDKSCFLRSMDDEVLAQVILLFPYRVEAFDKGFKYIGYFMKPNKYKKEDWLWLVKKVEKRIGSWCYRWLSLDGILTLLKYVLMGILMY